jgi:hypothetical protein
LLLGALLAGGSAFAKPEFVVSIPNGLTNSCNTCHTKTTEPAEWNDFGLDMKDTLVGGVPDWAAICDDDSDGDGHSNGVELADPDCTWSEGDSNPSGDVFNPGDADSKPSDGQADAGGSTDTADTGGGTGGGGGCAGGPTSAPLMAWLLLGGAGLLMRRRVA